MEKTGGLSNALQLILNVGDHLLVKNSARRRFDTIPKAKGKKTKTVFAMCKIALCKTCFAPHHT